MLAAYAVKLKWPDTGAVMYNIGHPNYIKTEPIVQQMASALALDVQYISIPQKFANYPGYAVTGGDFRPKRVMAAMTLETVAFAEAHGYDSVVLGLLKSDLTGWKVKEFFTSVTALMKDLCGKQIKVVPIWSALSKNQVVHDARNEVQIQYGITVPLEQTWSCDNAGATPCQTCQGCQERAAAGLP
jgi:7-cyano-7-deazaguanine synthase in queuosine biosynthesis